MTVFNVNNSGWKTKQYPLFMGEEMALYDSVNINHQKLFDLYKQQVSQRWVETEFNHEQSRMDLLSCPKSIYDVMLLNLSFQWVLDSVASRAVAPLFAPFVTNSEFWAALMENSNMECHTENTEILTGLGWLQFKDLKEGVKVAQYDTTTKEITFVFPTSIIKKYYEGDVYCFKNKVISQTVTPEHRMPIFSNKSGKFYWKTAQEANYSAPTAIPVAGKVLGVKKTITAMERFLIAAQADGSISERYTGEIVGTIPVKFGFSKERKIERLISICKEAGLNIEENHWKSSCVGNQKHRRTFKVNVPVKYKNFIKSFEWVDFSNISHEWCKDFVEEVVLWDGSTHKAGNVHYCNTSKNCVDIVQAICTLAGYKTTFSHRIDNRKESFSDCYTVSWQPNTVFNKNTLRSGNSITKEKTTYSGFVYCVSVPTTAFIVRQDNKVSVSGNCIHALSYSEIVRQCVPDPNEVFKLSVENDKTIQRAVKVVQVFDELEKAGAEYKLGIRKNDQDTYNVVFKGLVALYILERLQFMASFAATFAVVEQGYFQSIGKMVQKIMIDEIFCHYALDAEALKIEMQTDRGKIAMQQCKQEIVEMIAEVVRQEESWSEYLFSDGRSIVGLNPTLLNEWVHYNAQAVYDGLGLSEHVKFARINSNPLKWMDNWIDIDKFQNAMQEADGNNYALNAVSDDIGDEEFDF